MAGKGPASGCRPLASMWGGPDGVAGGMRDDGEVPRRLLFCVVGLIVGLVAWWVAHDDPAYSFAQRSWVGVAALLGAGWALVGAAVASSTRPGRTVLAAVLAATGIGWFIGEFDSPEVSASPLFTVGLALAGVGPPLVTWVVLGYPSGRLTSWLDRATVVAGLVAGVVGIGVLPSLYFDPASTGCRSCATNLIALEDDPGRSGDLGGAGMWVAAVVTAAAIALAASRLWRSSSARRRSTAPIVVPGLAYLALGTWSYAASADAGYIASTEDERRRWLAQAVVLMALAAAIVWGEWRARRMRSAVARVAVRVDHARSPDALRLALARTLGDSGLDLVYPLADGSHVDAAGQPVDLPDGRRSSVTPLVSNGRRLATLVHKPGLLDNPVLLDEIVAAAGLALDNERLQAELLAQERELRASRRRVAEAGDAERRRLERNLHDGSQQRLIGLLLSARYAHSLLGTDADPALRDRLDQLVDELGAAIDDLRHIAHGIHPAILSDEGLAAAIESLADDVRTLQAGPLPEERFAPVTEHVAYRVVVAAAAAGPASVSMSRRDGTLALDVEIDRLPDDLVDIEDRVGAADGDLTTSRTTSGRITLRVELPCG
jgi:signal transduction histidine kinase